MCVLDYHRIKTKERLLRGEHVHWVHGHKRSSYLVAAVLSFPKWVDRKALLRLKAERDAKTKATGIPHVLDHIVPLNHPRVCGLSVPWNFKVVPYSTNASKGNAWCEWHGDLFSEPEQFKLFP